MSLGQREFGNIFTKEIKKEMSNKHIEIGRSGDNKITIKEYLITGAGVQPLAPITYDDVKIKIVGGRCLVISVHNDNEYYDCRYDDCVVKNINWKQRV
jgi:hypothetical protein